MHNKSLNKFNVFMNYIKNKILLYNIFMMDISEKLPLYSVFILFLIIASNYIGELFPCKMQNILVENVYLKHFIAFLTLMFFVVLTDPFIGTSFNKIIENSFKMYVVFLLLINNNKNFFILAIILLGVNYLLNLKKNDLTNLVENEKDEDQINTLKNQLEMINQINNYLIYIIVIIIIIGFIIYMGEKKIEYKDKFSYFTFIFGKPSCRGKSPDTKYVEAFTTAFT